MDKDSFLDIAYDLMILFLNLLSNTVTDPEISKGGAPKKKKGGGSAPEIAKELRYIGSQILSFTNISY
jgi:hypothetical protein